MTEVGLKDDEGTMAGILCRTVRQLFIGKRGGMTLANAAWWTKDENGNATKVPAANVKGERAIWAPTI